MQRTKRINGPAATFSAATHDRVDGKRSVRTARLFRPFFPFPPPYGKSEPVLHIFFDKTGENVYF
nr:hypothetical protein [Bacillaceae bacterium]